MGGVTGPPRTNTREKAEAGARSPDAPPMMRSQRCLSTRLASALQKTKEAVPARCCNAVVVSSVGPRGDATAVMAAHSCSTSRCWRPTSAFVVSLLVAALANILLSTSSSASPPMTISKLWSTAFPRKVRGQKSSSGLLQKKMLEVQISIS